LHLLFSKFGDGIWPLWDTFFIKLDLGDRAIRCVHANITLRALDFAAVLCAGVSCTIHLLLHYL
jgi:hypothetical protein